MNATLGHEQKTVWLDTLGLKVIRTQAGQQQPISNGVIEMLQVSNYAKRLKEMGLDDIVKRGGVMLPFHVGDTFMLRFVCDDPSMAVNPNQYAVMIGTGGVNILTGGEWTFEPNNYPANFAWMSESTPYPNRVVHGYSTKHGTRQFMYMGSQRNDLTAEAMVTGKTEGFTGGIQVVIYPMTEDGKNEIFVDMEAAGMRSLSKSAAGGIGAAGFVNTQDTLSYPYEMSYWDKERQGRVWLHPIDMSLYCSLTGKPETHGTRLVHQPEPVTAQPEPVVVSLDERLSQLQAGSKAELVIGQNVRQTQSNLNGDWGDL